MSWDGSILKYDPDMPPLDEITDDWKLKSLATSRHELKRILTEYFKNNIAWEEGDYLNGLLNSESYCIEFFIDDEEPPTAVMLTVRGENPIPDLVKLSTLHGWGIIDGTNCKWVHLEGGASYEGFESAAKYTQHVIDNAENKKDKNSSLK